MKLKYLGTAAAEGIPGMFCHCEVCRKARESGGKDIRKRSQALIDGKILIDFGADTYCNSLQYSVDLASIETLIITHIHSDHLYERDFEMRNPGFSHIDGCKTLNVYGSRETYDRVMSIPGEREGVNGVKPHIVLPFEPFEAESYRITPLPAIHGTESPYIYIIEKDGKCMLYGNDTGGLKPECTEYIKNAGVKFDLLSLDCTEGDKPIDYPFHMNLERCDGVVKILREMGTMKDGASVVLNHFSHNGGHILYDDMCRRVKGRGYLVSYDGMEIEF